MDVDRKRQIVYENHLLLKKILNIDLQKGSLLTPSNSTKKTIRAPTAASVRSLHYLRKKKENTQISHNNAVSPGRDPRVDNPEETVGHAIRLQYTTLDKGIPQTPDAERDDLQVGRYG